MQDISARIHSVRKKKKGAHASVTQEGTFGRETRSGCPLYGRRRMAVKIRYLSAVDNKCLLPFAPVAAEGTRIARFAESHRHPDLPIFLVRP